MKNLYETYVQAHLEEHRQSRLKHWLVLLALSWKYRKSQISRLHTLTLVKQKDSRAKIRMEWIPGACCYNLYVSRDGVDYRFLEKTRRHVYTAEHLKQEQMYFFKYKVSMDGSRYSDFSEVLTVSTFLLRKDPGKREKRPKFQKAAGIFREVFRQKARQRSSGPRCRELSIIISIVQKKGAPIAFWHRHGNVLTWTGRLKAGLPMFIC